MLRIDTTNSLEWEKLPNGTYRAFATLGKVGLPLVYQELKKDGTLSERTETILEDELFSDISISTAWGLPVTLGHPITGEFSRNKEGLQVGALLQEIRKDDGELIMPIVVHDRRGIDVIEQARKQGLRAELSPGYRIDRLVPIDDGTYAQCGRKYDHLALLSPGLGRGNQSISIRIDSLEPGTAIAKSLLIVSQEEKVGVDIAVRNDSGSTVFRDVDPVLAAEIDRLQNRLDRQDSTIAETETTIETQKTELATLKADKDRIDGENTGLKTKIEELENNRLDDTAIAQQISERIQLWGEILPQLRKDKADFVPDYKLSSDEIRRFYLSVVVPDLKLDGRSSEYIEGIWEGLKPRLDDKSRQQVDDVFKAIDLGTQTSPPVKNDARQKHIELIEKNSTGRH